MRTQSILLFLLLIFLPGCLLTSSPRESFLKEVHVDVVGPGRPDEQHTQLKLSVQEGPHFSRQDLPVSLELRLPVRELKEATVELTLYETGKTRALRTARLSQLRAGKLELVLSTAGLAPGSYCLTVTLKPSSGPDSLGYREAVSFELTEGLPRKD